MKIYTIGATLAATVLAAAFALAASPQIGSWKLNESKSTLAGTSRNHMVVYTETGDSVKVTIDGVDSAGKAFRSEWTGKFDGKDYPVTGDSSSDMRSYKVVNPSTLSFQTKKAGKVLLEGTIVVAADGKSRTVHTTGTNDKGEKVTQMSVYDKQ